MERQEVLDKMFNGKMVRITKEERRAWLDTKNYSPCNIGQWFYIRKYNADDTVEICSNSTHEIFTNTSIKDLRP